MKHRQESFGLALEANDYYGMGAYGRSYCIDLTPIS